MSIKYILSGIFCFFIISLLFFGLWPFEFEPANQVFRLKNKPGLHFNNNSIVLEPVIKSHGTLLSQLNNDDEFSMEIKLIPSIKTAKRLSCIFCIYDEREPEIILLGKWKSHTILRRRIELAGNKTSSHEVSIPDSLFHDQSAIITVSMCTDGTLLSINNEKNVFFPGFNLKRKNQLFSNAQLLVGNDTNVKTSWNGEINGFAIYRRALKREEIERHKLLWNSNNFSKLSREKDILALFPMHETHGQVVRNMITGKNNNLLIPEKLFSIKKTILGGPWINFWHDERFYYDIIINIIGFIPFGLLLLALFISNNKTGYFFYAITVISGFGLSLMIELIQVFMPLRTSSITDLISNTIGTLIGVIIFHFAYKYGVLKLTHR
jgi:hypothetical protein